MANGAISVTDPLGKTILLLQGCAIADEPNSSEIYDDAATVIEKPAILIEVTENDTTSYYYWRSIGWHNTMLIRVHFQNGQWEAVECKRNPTHEEISEILIKGKSVL